MTTASSPTPADQPSHPTPATPRSLLIDREEFARLLAVSVPTLDRRRRAGKLPRPVCGLGGALVRWQRAEVEAWLTARGEDGRLLDMLAWAKVRERVMKRAG